jgi:hypothetical protein
MTDAFRKYYGDIHRCIDILSPLTAEARFTVIREWYQTGGRDRFSAVFQHETGSRLNEGRAAGQRVELGIYKSPKDAASKVKDPKFYLAHAEWFIAEFDRILEADAAYTRTKFEPYFSGLNDLLKTFLLDSIVLLEDFATWHQQVPGVFGIVKSRRELNAALYNDALQTVYGSYSPLASPIKSTDMAISSLRMNIEMRLRCGFGVLGIHDQTKDAFMPLGLSKLIAAASEHQRGIKFGRPIAHIDRIYRWANLYVHGGFKLYTWCAPALLYYLRPFLLGGNYKSASSSGMSIYAGIQTTTATLLDVQQSIRSASDLRENLVLVTYQPGDCDLILTDV